MQERAELPLHCFRLSFRAIELLGTRLEPPEWVRLGQRVQRSRSRPAAERKTLLTDCSSLIGAPREPSAPSHMRWSARIGRFRLCCSGLLEARLIDVQRNTSSPIGQAYAQSSFSLSFGVSLAVPRLVPEIPIAGRQRESSLSSDNRLWLVPFVIGQATVSKTVSLGLPWWYHPEQLFHQLASGTWATRHSVLP